MISRTKQEGDTFLEGKRTKVFQEVITGLRKAMLWCQPSNYDVGVDADNTWWLVC